jgi:hypothetical protein
MTRSRRRRTSFERERSHGVLTASSLIGRSSGFICGVAYRGRCCFEGLGRAATEQPVLRASAGQNGVAGKVDPTGSELDPRASSIVGITMALDDTSLGESVQSLCRAPARQQKLAGQRGRLKPIWRSGSSQGSDDVVLGRGDLEGRSRARHSGFELLGQLKYAFCQLAGRQHCFGQLTPPRLENLVGSIAVHSHTLPESFRIS